MKIIEIFNVTYKIENNVLYKWVAWHKDWVKMEKEEIFLDNKIILERGRL